jgi:hypothetical protein
MCVTDEYLQSESIAILAGITYWSYSYGKHRIWHFIWWQLHLNWQWFEFISFLDTGPPAWQRFIAEQCISSRVLMCLKWNHGMLEFWDISMQGNWVHAFMFQMNSVSLCEIHGTSDVNSNVRSMKADYSKFIVHCYYSMHASISTAAISCHFSWCPLSNALF